MQARRSVHHSTGPMLLTMTSCVASHSRLCFIHAALESAHDETCSRWPVLVFLPINCVTNCRTVEISLGNSTASISGHLRYLLAAPLVHFSCAAHRFTVVLITRDACTYCSYVVILRCTAAEGHAAGLLNMTQSRTWYDVHGGKRSVRVGDSRPAFVVVRA
jgi:hypothetical protein